MGLIPLINVSENNRKTVVFYDYIDFGCTCPELYRLYENPLHECITIFEFCDSIIIFVFCDTIIELKNRDSIIELQNCDTPLYGHHRYVYIAT